MDKFSHTSNADLVENLHTFRRSGEVLTCELWWGSNLRWHFDIFGHDARMAFTSRRCSLTNKTRAC